MNKESLKEYLSSRYQGWSSFLNNVIFPIFGEDDFEDGFETELLESQPERRQLAPSAGRDARFEIRRCGISCGLREMLRGRME